ncbi:MAG: hypothetical protein KJO75_23525 [Dactylosporangium sp.]|nr:hypothetical protein [Dactylosporangium sp.]
MKTFDRIVDRIRVWWVVLGVVIVVLVTWFAAPYIGRRSLETVPEPEVRQRVLEYVHQTVSLTGGKLQDEEGDKDYFPHWEPCERRGDDAYRVLGIYGVDVDPGQGLAALHLTKDRWQGLGYKITEEKYHADGVSGDLAAFDPESRFGFSLYTSDTEWAFVLNVASPCYRSPVPLDQLL